MGKYKEIKEDIMEIKKDAPKMWRGLRSVFHKHKSTELIVGFIDNRYFEKDYVIRWAKLNIAPHILEDKIEKIKKETPYTLISSASDLFTEKEYKDYVLFESDELSGYETDTPTMFDILIQ